MELLLERAVFCCGVLVVCLLACLLSVEACRRKLSEGETRDAVIDAALKNVREGNTFYTAEMSRDVTNEKKPA